MFFIFWMTVTWIYTKDDQRCHLKRLVPFPTPATLQAIQPSKLKESQGLFHLWSHIKVPALLPWLVPSSLQMGLRTSLASFPRAWISFSSPSSNPGATLWSDLSVYLPEYLLLADCVTPARPPSGTPSAASCWSTWTLLVRTTSCCFRHHPL